MAKDKYQVLKQYFGFSSFRPGQGEVIDAILEGKDVLAILPTGGGKSLCYQIPALLLPGITIVISPLISLMKDQVQALRAAGIPACFLNSSLSTTEYSQTMTEVKNGGAKLLYLAPERLQKREITSFLFTNEVPLVVIDEAHCISQWGHDFRPSYLDIAGFIKGLENKTYMRSRPVCAAFTATATPKVKENIQQLLRFGKRAFVFSTSFDRPNLYFEVQKPKDKKAALLSCFEKRRKASGIVYCATRKAVDELYILFKQRGFAVTRYHAGLEDAERRINQDNFLYDRKTIMIATNAFGMGIDKPNVSFVIHYNMPKNIESYYQEAGRAGRNGNAADCILLYNGQDVQINKYLITHSEDDEITDSELEKHKLELLRQMTFFATSGDCLRRRLLAYFGEESPSYCGHCSFCLAEFEETDITDEAQKIISCVFEFRQRNRSFGKTMIIDILKGKKTEKTIRFGVENLDCWGTMASYNDRRIRIILEYLINKGILLSSGDEYPVVLMGETEEILREKKRVLMSLPKEEPVQKPEKRGRNKTEKPEADQELPLDDSLLKKLKELRKEFAAKEGVSSFIVFSDANLKDICRKKPVNLAEFSVINGVGPVKLEKYGEHFTSLVSSYLNK